MSVTLYVCAGNGPEELRVFQNHANEIASLTLDALRERRKVDEILVTHNEANFHFTIGYDQDSPLDLLESASDAYYALRKNDRGPENIARRLRIANEPYVKPLKDRVRETGETGSVCLTVNIGVKAEAIASRQAMVRCLQIIDSGLTSLGLKKYSLSDGTFNASDSCAQLKVVETLERWNLHRFALEIQKVVCSNSRIFSRKWEIMIDDVLPRHGSAASIIGADTGAIGLSNEQ